MSFFDELSDVTDAAIAMFGRDGAGPGTALQLVWGAFTISCFEEDETTKLELVVGGLIEETDVVVRARKSAFGTGALPQQNNAVTLGGKPLKVRHAMTSHGDPELRLALMGPNQRK